MSGIYEYDEACMSANMATIRQNNAINNEINEMYITLLTNFFIIWPLELKQHLYLYTQK